MKTGTELYCMNDLCITSLKQGRIYTLEDMKITDGVHMVSLRELNVNYSAPFWVGLWRFEQVDPIDISELTNLLLN